jgi:hypothetical protein
MNIVRRTTGILAMLMMILSTFAQTPMVYCLGCEDEEITRHTCCDKKGAERPIPVIEPIRDANATKPVATCVNCVRVVFRVQMAPTAKSVVESLPQHVTERLLPTAAVRRVVSFPARLRERFNSPARLLRTVQLLI